MSDDLVFLNSGFSGNGEAAWLDAVAKALKGRGPDSLTRRTADGIGIQALYREDDFASASDPLGLPGEAPFLRGRTGAPDRWLPWDIRQAFTHPSPVTTNAEILRDLERGVSSAEIVLDPDGAAGVQVTSAGDFETLLAGVRADIAPVALSHAGNCGAEASLLLADWAEQAALPSPARLDFNIDPLGCLARSGRLEGGLEAVFTRIAEVAGSLAARFPAAGLVRIDACGVHEAGASEAQELAALIASAIDTLRRLPGGLAPGRLCFSLALDANYGLGIAKLRAARRLWARCLEALGEPAAPMRLQAVTSARMLTRYDPWTNILRVTAAVFAGATGGADIVTARAFNEALGCPEELGRRIARNTQIIAMEESHLGRVADPTGGAWFTEKLADELATTAWKEFQTIEGEGGFAASLLSGAFQSRVRTVREARRSDIARRRVAITGVSEFPMSEEIPAPVANLARSGEAGPARAAAPQDTTCEALAAVRLADDFEKLRDSAAASLSPPRVFLATLGNLAEFTPRADFCRNLLAAGGLLPVQPEEAAQDIPALARAFRASGCRLAVLCGTDAAYEAQAGEAVAALRAAGADQVWLAGRSEIAGLDHRIYAGCDVLEALRLAHKATGVAP